MSPTGHGPPPHLVLYLRPGALHCSTWRLGLHLLRQHSLKDLWALSGPQSLPQHWLLGQSQILLNALLYPNPNSSRTPKSAFSLPSCCPLNQPGAARLHRQPGAFPASSPQPILTLRTPHSATHLSPIMLLFFQASDCCLCLGSLGGSFLACDFLSSSEGQFQCQCPPTQCVL
jgi:hypothetical protein